MKRVTFISIFTAEWTLFEYIFIWSTTAVGHYNLLKDKRSQFYQIYNGLCHKSFSAEFAGDGAMPKINMVLEVKIL